MPLQFGEFTFDRATRQLLRGGRDVHLEPKAFELLDLLLERRPEAVSKPEIRDRLWPDTFVSESSLTTLVAQLREALGDDRGKAKHIRTVHGFGYAFTAGGGTASATAAPSLAPRVIWGRRIIPLAPGESILGRDEEAAVRIDAPGVSRRHARILHEEGRAVLEDLGSKNGTFLREDRLQAPAILEDGDTFRLGQLLLVYRDSALHGSTKTEAGRS
jgi:DNA-binding winged helix-turn-helix (wHTH) protein